MFICILLIIIKALNFCGHKWKNLRQKVAENAISSQFNQWHIIKALYSGFRVKNEQHSFTTYQQHNDVTSDHSVNDIMTSPTHHHFAWHPKNLCGVSRNQLTSTVNGENPGSRPPWSMHISWTTPQSENRALLSLNNSGRSWTVSAPDKVTAVPVRRNGNFLTLISVPAVSLKRCRTLSNPAHRQNYTVACLNYTLQTMIPLPGWPAMASKCIRQQQ